MERRMILYTGIGGMDMFDEALEEHVGMKRFYMSKVPRILRKVKGIKIRKSRTGRWYRRIGGIKVNMDMNYGFESYKIAP